MEFDKKTILAFLLIGLILIFLQTDLYKNNFLPPPPEPNVSEQSREIPDQSRENTLPKKIEEEPTSLQTYLEPEKPIKYQDLLGEGEKITVETNLYSAVFSTRGATVGSWELKKYFLDDGPNVQLVGSGKLGNLALLLPTNEDTIDTSPFIFTVNKKEIVLNEEKRSDVLEFTLNFDEYKTIKKTYTFYYDKYDFSLVVEFRNFENVIDGFSYFLIWRSGLETTEPDLKNDMMSTKAYAFQGDAESYDAESEFDPKEWDNPTDWVALRTKYFALAAIPGGVKAQAVKFKAEQINVGQETKLKKYGFDLQMPFEGQREKKSNFTIYFGPLDYDIIKSYNINLEKMMDLGWVLFRPFAKIILWSFNGLHKVIPNYGFIIIIFSILIKIVLYPLTKKSYQSMKAMQNLQPLMQEINEKHKSDPQKKQQEIMKLYKEHGVNPLGGCIPMVLQMPLLIALFNVFRSTIQLRQAPFIWWITDLSRPDTIALLPFTVPLYGNTVNILPLFMGITMFIQQKISMKDPKQKAMVYIMPLFMTLLFNSFPSGLNLYYALFNIFSIIQEKYVPSKQKTTTEPGKKTNKKRRIKHDYKGRFHK